MSKSKKNITKKKLKMRKNERRKLMKQTDKKSKLGKKVSKSKVAPGDLIFFGKGSKVSHVAIVKANTGNSLEVIHSTSGSGVRVDDINTSHYQKKRYLYARKAIN